MQLINIFFQGSLYQDLPLQVPESLEHAGGEHGVIIRDNPFIEAVESKVNSSHHQAVKRVGKGLNPFAWAHDGVIEALYGEDLSFLVGVQWHPERMKGFLSKQVFERFIGACRA
jgi:putative glutamine amidotransferase